MAKSFFDLLSRLWPDYFHWRRSTAVHCCRATADWRTRWCGHMTQRGLAFSPKPLVRCTARPYRKFIPRTVHVSWMARYSRQKYTVAMTTFISR